MPPKSKQAAAAPEDGEAERTKMIMKMVERAPKSMQNVLSTAAPYISKAETFRRVAWPYFAIAYFKIMELWKKLEPYHPEDALPCFTGLVLVFFGGTYPMIIAAVEAFRMTGYEPVLRGIKEITRDVAKVLEESAKDDAKDDDKDGVADVVQISPEELLLRKTKLVLKTIDPDEFNRALVGITSGVMAVLATLKVQFARAVTLGAAIGQIMLKPAMRYAAPPLKKLLDEDLHKWIPIVMGYLCTSIAISIAMWIQRFISAFHSAVRGGQMFSRGVLHYLKTHGKISVDHNDTSIDEYAGYVMAGLGLLFQVRCGFSLPFPVNLLLFPFTVFEKVITWAVLS